MTGQGWFQKQDDLPGLLRWWDGTHWTSHTKATEPSPVAPQPPNVNAAVIDEIRRQGVLSRRAAERRRRYWASTLTGFMVLALIIYVIIQFARHT